MKVTRVILIVLAIIIGLFLIVALFLPPTYYVERSTTIEKPVDVVFDYVADYSLRSSWDPWVTMDTTATTSFLVDSSQAELTTPERFLKSEYKWSEGSKIGSGSLTIEKIVENSSIESKLEFTAPQKMESKVYWSFKSENGKTTVDWANAGNARYPVGRYFGLFLDGMLGPDLEKGLENLKDKLESLQTDSETAQ
jgi:hypothetical protein